MRVPTRLWIPLLTLVVGVGAGFLLRGGDRARVSDAGHGKKAQCYVCDVHGHIHEGPGRTSNSNDPEVK